MKKDKKIKKLQARDIPKFEDIQRTAESELEPYREFEGTIPNGTLIIQPNEKKSEE